MASMYSWSSKRSYKNGFVWHDLAENDFICPAHGKEYVLKGSEVLDTCLSRAVHGTASSRSLRPPEINKSDEDSDFPVITRRRNQSWSSIDLNEYKVYKAESSGESAGKAAADASTQTEEKRRRRRSVREKEDEEDAREEKAQRETCQSRSTELSRDEISPPPSDSSPETLESLMKFDICLIPEVRFNLHGPHGVLQHLKYLIETKGSAVVCVAEGAGQDFLQKTNAKDASGNIVFGDIGVHIQQETKKHFKEIGVPVDVKYIDPTYMIRACRANASDGILCAVLGQNAVHGAFAGYSGITVGICNTHYVYLPIPEVISHPRLVDANSRMWHRCLTSTGQPDFI